MRVTLWSSLLYSLPQIDLPISKSGKMWLTTFTVMTWHLPVVLMTILVAFSSGVVVLVQATGSCLLGILKCDK